MHFTSQLKFCGPTSAIDTVMKKEMINILLPVFLLASYAFGERAVPYLENSRITFDLSSRTSYFERNDEFQFQQFIGFDFYSPINDGVKDWGYITLQPYLHRIDNGTRTPAYYDDFHDWEFILRTAAITYTGMGYNLPWIRVGHFEVPFGVEHTKNTFGNLHQYAQTQKLGIKVDWGIAIGQELEKWQYEFSLTRGSGLKYRDRENPYAFSGRIGTLNDNYWAAGMSVFYGDVLRGKSVQNRQLFAIDFQYFWNSWGLLSEFNIGDIDEKDSFGSLLEVNWRNMDESLKIYAQYHYRDTRESAEISSVVFGTLYRISSNLLISAQMNNELSQLRDNFRENIFELQIRYLF